MEGSYYTASFYKTFSAREKRLMNELFGPNYPKEDLNDNSISRILSKLRPPAQAKMKVPELLPNMKRHWCLTESELEDIKNESLSHYEQVLALLDSLQNRGSYGIGSLYLSLRESSDEMYGTPTHYQLAFELKSIIHAEVNRVTQLLTDTQDSKSPVKEELGGLIACFRGVAVAQEEAESLVDFLGLPVGQFPDRPDDLASVLFLWYRKRSVGGSLVDIVEALMLTRGLGRHVVLLCKNGDCSCAHAVEGFLHGLGDRWLAIPEYLGYSRQEVVAITSDGVVGFLDEWQMPDCGQKTLMLLQKLKSLAGIQDSRTTGSSRPVTKVNPTQSLLLDSCDFSNPSPFSSLPARTVRLSPRPRPSTPPPSPPPSPRHQSSPEESKPLSYDKSYFQQTGKLVFIRLESKTYQDDGYYDDGSYRTTTKQHSPPSIEEVMDDETPVQSKLSRTTEPSDSHVTNRHSKTTNENNFTEMNNFEAMNNFGSVEDGVSSAAQPKAALVNSFDSLAAVDKEEGMVQMSAQNSLEMDAGHRPEQQAPSSPPPSPVSPSPSQQTVSTESAQQPNLTASSPMLTPPNSPQSSPGHHTSLSQGTSSPSQVTPSQVQEPSSLQPNQLPAANGGEDPLDSSLPSHAAGQLDHRNTIAAASVEGEHRVCDWDMVDAIREEDGMEMLTSLLDGGSSVNLPLKNDSGDYPLHLAVLSGSEVKVRTLLDHGATVDVRRAKDQRTPLLLACHSKGCSSSIITILVNQGADVAALDKRGQCVLHSSELLLQSDLAAMILTKDHSLADTHGDDHITPLTVACRVGDEACTTAELLISKGAGINGFSRAVETPLMAASGGGHIRLVELLLRSGANINKSDRKTRTTPLLKACLNSRFEVAKTLLDAGADVTLPDKDGKTPLVGAVVICCEDIVALLVNHPGVDVNYSRTLPDRFNRMQGVTPLADAAARGKVPIVRMLVEHGAHINKTSEDPDTSLPPITFAAMLGLTDVLQYFLSLPELDCSLEGLTKPVTVAIEQKQIGCARLLVDKYGGLEKMRADAENQDLLDRLQQLAEQISAEETRSSHEAASEDQKPEGTALSDEDPFTSRPKSPPPLPDTDQQQQQHLSSDLSSMISQQSFQSEAAEVLNDFAQYLIHASVQRNTPETIILKAESIGEPHLVTFFVRYFHDSSSISRWGEFVGDFLKGFPSPLNFLLSFRLASRSEFEKIIKEVGRPDFSEQLMLAFHQFPNSESLPWTASGLMDAMFEQPLGGLRDEYALREQLQQHLESAQRSIGQQSSSTIESSTAAGGFNAPGHRLGTAAEVKQQQRQQQQDDWQQDENLINASSIAASEARQEMESSQEVEPELNSFPATDEVPSACDSYNNLNDLDTADEAEPTTMEEPRSREPPPVTNSLSTGGAAVAKPLSFSDTPISSTSDTETIPAAKPLAYSNAVPKTPTPLNAVPMTPTPLNAVPMTPTPLNAVPKTPTPLNAVPKTLPSSNALSAAKPLPPSSSASVSALPVSTTAAAKPSQSPINLYPEVRANRGQHQHSHRTTATPTPTTPPITIHSNSPNPSRSQSSPSPPLSSRKLSAAAGTSSDSDSALPPPQPPSTSTTALTSLTTTTSQGETQPVQSAPLMSSTDSEDENPLSRMAASVAAEKRTMSIKGTAATSVGRMNDKKGGASVLAGKSGKTVRPPLSAAKHQADKTSTKPLATGGGRSSTKPLPSSATKPSLTAATKSLLGSRSSSTESLKKAAGTAKTTSTGITVKTTAKTTPTVTAAGVGRGKRPSSADKLTKSVAATTASDKKGTASPKTRRAGEVTSSKPAAKQEDNKPKATKQEDNQPTSAAASKPAIQEKEHEVTAVGVAHKPQAPPITEPSKAARDTVTSVLLPDHSDPSHPVQKSKTSSPQAESTHSVQSWTPSLQGSLLPSLQESLPSNQLTEGDDILKKLAPQLTNWKMLARYLLLEDSEIDHISLSYMFPVEQAYQMLRAWVRRSDDSTFAVLGEALSNCLKEDLVLQLAQYTRQQQSSLTEKREGEIEGVSELTSLWSTIQPHVDSFAKQGYSKVHVQMTFYK